MIPIMQRRRASRALSVLTVIAVAACSSESDKPSKPKPSDAGRDTDSGRAPGFPNFGDGGDNPGLIDASGVMAEDAGPPKTVLVITPGMGNLEVDSASPKPIAFTAVLSNGAPSEVPIAWSTDHRDLGAIDAMSGMFKANGAAGVVTVYAKAGSLTSWVTITIVVKAKQEGDPDSGGMPAGAGGLGGVGGEGGGSKITDPALRAALDKAAAEDAELVFLYPYDGTVWPRGLPAPLLQWRHGAHVPVAVKLHIEVAPNYSADVYLGPPPALTAGAPIDRIPIPQAIWKTALQSGTTMQVSLTIAASDGAGGFAAYAPSKPLIWKIAPTTLRGTVYYNSYGTKLAENYAGAKGGNGRFGGATLAITRDSFDPTLIAGSTTTDPSGCRVCHTVSANGSLMIVQHDDNRISSRYDLRNMNVETPYPTADDGKFGWSGLSYDGTIALGNSGPPSSPSNVANGNSSALYRVADGVVLTAQGLSEFVTQAATPVFSFDTKKVAFNLYSGPGTPSIPANGTSLVAMDVAKVDDTTYTFTNPKALYTATGANQLPGWPAFLPDGSGVVFQLELSTGNGEHFVTRGNAHGELWWTDMNGNASALERANGKGYLPAGAAGKNHDNDATLQYEPTVAPIVAGGYAWVVFTSRRSYGNVATREPFQSDARAFDLTAGNPDGPTTKKLWVTAIDIPAKAGTDPSHPAFYLPAQELFAGNSRGYWVLDACKENSGVCTGGDECCGGYCRIDPESGMGLCMDIPEDACSKEYDKCNVDSDCCADAKTPLYCIAGRCATNVLQ